MGSAGRFQMLQHPPDMAGHGVGKYHDLHHTGCVGTKRKTGRDWRAQATFAGYSRRNPSVMPGRQGKLFSQRIGNQRPHPGIGKYLQQ